MKGKVPSFFRSTSGAWLDEVGFLQGTKGYLKKLKDLLLKKDPWVKADNLKKNNRIHLKICDFFIISVSPLTAIATMETSVRHNPSDYTDILWIRHNARIVFLAQVGGSGM